MSIFKYLLLTAGIFSSVLSAQASERVEYFTGEHAIFREVHPVLVKRILSDSGSQVLSEERSELLAPRREARACTVKSVQIDFQGDEAEWISSCDTFSFWINHSGDGSDTAVGIILSDGTQKIEWSHHAREGAVTSVSHEVLHPISKEFYELNLGFKRSCL